MLISTPYDPEARYGKKRDTEWTGYKVHLTETCDADTPALITDVETTATATSDIEMVAPIQQHLAARDLLPGEHFLDAGYMGADQLVTNRTEHGVDLIGPMPAETSQQAKAQQGFATACFGMDWEARRAICPQGHRSTQRLERLDHRGHAVVHIKFARAACAA